MTDGILAQSTTTPDSFEPMVFEGENHGLVHWVRNDVRNGHEYRSAIWVMPEEQLPYVSPYTFVNDETFTILEGELEITWDDGSVTIVREGDIISVAGGTASNWRITKPLKKFVVEVQL
ncbi:cupin domain-containing protein [Pseudolysinimonas sp.]